MGKVPSLSATLTTSRLSSSPSTCFSTTLLLRTTFPHNHLPSPPQQQQQTRNATFVPRPRRPYTFTQLVQLSDGSTYTLRTTSPNPILRSTKDSRNTLLWQPSEKALRNVELDEAGKLAAFRERFGRGFDISAAGGAADSSASAAAAASAEKKATKGDAAAAAAADAAEEGDVEDADDAGADLDFESLMSGYADKNEGSLKEAGPKRSKSRRK